MSELNTTTQPPTFEILDPTKMTFEQLFEHQNESALVEFISILVLERMESGQDISWSAFSATPKVRTFMSMMTDHQQIMFAAYYNEVVVTAVEINKHCEMVDDTIIEDDGWFDDEYE